MRFDENAKSRYFWFVIYLEDVPEFLDLVRILKETHLAFLISPLHSQDAKHLKPHWHVIFDYGNTVRFCTAKKLLIEELELPIGANYIEPVKRFRIACRYLCHLDDLDKEQFEDPKEQITIINGCPLDLRQDLSEEQKIIIRRQIFEFIDEWNILEYSELLDVLLYTDDDMHDYAFNHTIAFNAYLKSKRHSRPADIVAKQRIEIEKLVREIMASNS